jgi:hypothetical protein
MIEIAAWKIAGSVLDAALVELNSAVFDYLYKIVSAKWMKPENHVSFEMDMYRSLRNLKLLTRNASLFEAKHI